MILRAWVGNNISFTDCFLRLFLGNIPLMVAISHQYGKALPFDHTVFTIYMYKNILKSNQHSSNRLNKISKRNSSTNTQLKEFWKLATSILHAYTTILTSCLEGHWQNNYSFTNIKSCGT